MAHRFSDRDGSQRCLKAGSLIVDARPGGSRLCQSSEQLKIDGADFATPSGFGLIGNLLAIRQ